MEPLFWIAKLTRPTCLRINLDALVHNANQAQKSVPGSRLICCVKANAYGHGMIEVARALKSSAPAFAVACLDEALELRESGIDAAILVLGGVYDGVELRRAISAKCWLVLHSQQQVDLICSEGLSGGSDMWLKLDTGMHRMGLTETQLKLAYQRLSIVPGIGNIRLMTHFACAHDPSDPFTRMQIDKFRAVAKGLPVETSMANSAAMLAWPESLGDWARPGYMLYGNSPLASDGFHHLDSNLDLRPMMQFESKVVDIRSVAAGESVGYERDWTAKRDSRIALVAAGYGDGYPRNTRNGAPVMVEGCLASTVGKVSMDSLSIDISRLSDVHIGSKVELWGPDLSVNAVAGHSGFSPYELLTRLPPRAPRFYSGCDS